MLAKHEKPYKRTKWNDKNWKREVKKISIDSLSADESQLKRVLVNGKKSQKKPSRQNTETNEKSEVIYIKQKYVKQNSNDTQRENRQIHNHNRRFLSLISPSE